MTQAGRPRTASVNRRCVRQPWEGCRHFLTYQHVLAGKLPAFLLVDGGCIPYGDWPSSRERSGHWLRASSERNIRHSNRAVILLSRRRAAGLRCPWAARVHDRSPLVAGRGAAGRASRRRTMPPPLTSRALYGRSGSGVFPWGGGASQGGDAWPDKGRGGAWEEEVRAAGPSAPTPCRGTAGTVSSAAGGRGGGETFHEAGRRGLGLSDAFMLWFPARRAGTPLLGRGHEGGHDSTLSGRR